MQAAHRDAQKLSPAGVARKKAVPFSLEKT
jgi:hypothetical protein